MMIDDYISKIENYINNKTEKECEELLFDIFAVFNDEISNIKSGTTYETSVFNVVLNCNDLDEPLSENYDVVYDLKLMMNKLKLLRDSKNTNTTTNINVFNSKINKSAIASNVKIENKDNKNKSHIFGIIVGIFTIIGVIFAILFGFHIL